MPIPPKILTIMSEAGTTGSTVEALGSGARKRSSSAAETGRAFAYALASPASQPLFLPLFDPLWGSCRVPAPLVPPGVLVTRGAATRNVGDLGSPQTALPALNLDGEAAPA